MKNKLISLILKEKNIILYGLFSSVVLFLIYLLFLYTPLYYTTASLFIKNIPKQDVITNYGGGSIVRSESGYSNPLFNLVKILESETLSSRIYEKLKDKYKKDLSVLGVNSKENWHGVFLNMLSSKVEPSTDIINISLKWSNKKNTSELLNIVIEEFKNENLSIRKSVETKQRKYLDIQLANIEDKLDTVRREIKDFKLTNMAVDVNNEITELTKARVDLEKQAEILKSELVYSDKKLADFSKQIGFPDAQSVLKSTAIGGDPYLVDLSRKLSAAQQLHANLSANFTPNFPEVLAVKNEIIEIKNDIGKRQEQSLEKFIITRGLYDKPSQDIATDLARVQAEKFSIQGQLNALNKGIKNIRKREAQIPTKILGLEQLQKEEDALKSAYNSVKQKQLEAQIKENEIVDNIIILNNPSSASYLFSLLVLKFCGFMLLGFMAALGIIWIKDDIEDKWTDSGEIENVTGKSALGAIPWLKNSNFEFNSFIQNSNSIMGLAYGNIAFNIIRKSNAENVKIISFISTTDSRNESSITSNMALTFAGLNKKVILVDTDFTQPAKLFNSLNLPVSMIKKDILTIISEIKNDLRFSNDLNDRHIDLILKEAIIPIDIELNDGTKLEFSYLCAGSKTHNIHSYIATPGYNRILEYLKRQYELVLIDTPSRPFIFPEFSIITNTSDSVVLISGLRNNKNKLTGIINKLNQNNINTLGIVSREEDSALEKYFYKEFGNISSEKTSDETDIMVSI
ncbi:MAG: hypothetical protein PHV68_02780 [Candidatus Gastranaerophilales bacterium]|nr:hypothetical protein [Candidatus Gastranaerophilales bacterium]